MKNLKVIAFTHKHVELRDLGNLVICNEDLKMRLAHVRTSFAIPEIFYLGTCNRVEFVFYSEHTLDHDFLKAFFKGLNFCVPDQHIEQYIGQVSTYSDIDAMRHLLRMSCSLESLVVGEKEILAQVRKAYEFGRESGFTGDFLRLVMNRLVKTAKEVYTYTKISRNPISVVSLAYRQLRGTNICSNSRILIIGAGETNINFSRYLQKHKYSNFAVFNRTFSKAEQLAKDLNGKAFNLAELSNYKEGFDVIIACTGATEPTLTKALYEQLLNGETSTKIVVDLGIPNDIDKAIIASYPVHYIEISTLQEIANKNLQTRHDELVHADKIVEENIAEFIPIIRERQVELAMRAIPEKVKEIKSFAMNTVFANDLNDLDESAKAVLSRVINYMEKKYISIPMMMAKDILVKEMQKNETKLEESHTILK